MSIKFNSKKIKEKKNKENIQSNVNFIFIVLLNIMIVCQLMHVVNAFAINGIVWVH